MPNSRMMTTPELTQDYQRITAAITYIQRNYREQPSLQDVAQHVHLSPHHFQRLFTRWAGISPKKFIQFLSLEHAKRLLAENETVLESSHAAGLSGPSRLHDLFVSLEAMTPGEFKNAGAALAINYQFAQTLFGPVLVASTARGICHIHFSETASDALADLKARFPNARFTESDAEVHQQALRVLNASGSAPEKIPLHIQGTAFQIKVWQSLLQIPQGQLRSYGQIAQAIEQPSASRAVGTAIGANPMAYLIPCHRVIQSSGHAGGYRWGLPRKAAMIAWEAAQACD